MSLYDDLSTIKRLWRTDTPAAARYLIRIAPTLPVEHLRAMVTITYVNLDYPTDVLPVDDWIALWRSCGYMVSGKPAARPRKPMRLFRACVPGKERGISWTANRDYAEAFRWFALDEDGIRVYRGPGSDNPVGTTNFRVVTAVAPPLAVLGAYRSDVFDHGPHFDPEQHTRREHRSTRMWTHEYQVDPTHLKITEAAPLPYQANSRPSRTNGPARTRSGRVAR